MPGNRKLKVEILGDGSGAEKALGDVAKSGESSGSRLSSALSSAMGQLGLPFTGAVDAFGQHLDAAGGKSTSFGQKIGSAAQGITLGTAAAVAAAAGMAVHLAMDYDASTGKIAASAGISIGAAKQIGAAFLATGGSTTFTAQQMSDAYAAVAGQLGATQGHALSAKQALDVMRASTDLAEASGSQLGNATSDLATLMQAYGIKASGAGQASDELFNAANITGQGIDNVTNVTQRLHSQLGVLSPSLSDTAGLMVDLTKHGETGRAAVSGVSTAFSTLLGGTKPVTKELGTLGLHVYDSSGKFVGMGSVMAQLQPKLQGMSQQQQLLALQTLFGKAAADKMLTTVLAGPQAFAAATAAVDRSRSAHDAAERATNNLKGQSEKLKAGMIDLGTRIGEALIPKLLAVEKAVVGVIKWFEKHKTAAEVLGIAIGVVLAGALAIYVTNLAVAGVKSAIEFVKMIAQGVAWVAGQAASIGESLALWAMYGAEWIAQQTGDLVAWVTLNAGAAASWVAEQASSIAESLALWVAYGAEWVAKTAVSLATWAAENIAQAAAVLASNVVSAASTAAAWIAANATMLLATAGIGLAIAAVVIIGVEVAKHWSEITHAIAGAWDWVRKEAVRIWGLITGFFKKWWPEVIVVMTGGAMLLPVLLIKYWKQITADVTTAFDNIVRFFTTIPAKIVAALERLGTDIARVATAAWTAFASAVVAGWNAEVSFWSGLPGKIIGALGDVGSTLLHVGEDIMRGLVHGITNGVAWVGRALKGVVDKIKSFITNPLGIFSPSTVFQGYGVNLMEGLALGITGSSGAATGAMSQVSASLANFSIGGSSPSTATGAASSGPLGTPGVVTPAGTAGPSGSPSITINGYNLADPHKTAAEISWNLATAPVG